MTKGARLDELGRLGGAVLGHARSERQARHHDASLFFAMLAIRFGKRRMRRRGGRGSGSVFGALAGLRSGRGHGRSRHGEPFGETVVERSTLSGGEVGG